MCIYTKVDETNISNIPVVIEDLSQSESMIDFSINDDMNNVNNKKRPFDQSNDATDELYDLYLNYGKKSKLDDHEESDDYESDDVTVTSLEDENVKNS